MNNYVVGMFSLALLGLMSCTENRIPGKEHTDHDVAVRVVQVKSKKLSMPVSASGLLSSETEAWLSFKTSGIIQTIFVSEGEQIKKGQLLATLNLTEINAQVAQAMEGFQKAERDLQRVRHLYSDSVATLEQMQNASTAFSVAKQALEIARYNQSFSEIRSTTYGVVVRKLVNEGELVSAGTPVFFINANGNSDWILKIGVADKQWTRIAKGDKATISVDAYPGKTFSAIVSKRSEGADPYSGTYQIEIKIRPEGYAFASGMFAKAEIIPSKPKEYKLIPVESLIEGNGTSAYVFVPEEQHVKKLPVRIETIQDSDALVMSGLERVNEVIKDGAGFLTEHSTITILQ